MAANPYTINAKLEKRFVVEISIDKHDQVVEITAIGEIDLNSSPQLRKEIVQGVKSGHKVTINLSSVTYMDSSGVATLVEGLQSSSAKKQSFTLLSPSDAVMKVLKLAKLETIFDIQQTKDEPAT